MQPTTTNSLDPQVVALAKAIRDTESQGNPNAVGASGEYGSYQFTPETWSAYAGEAGINVPLQQATREQQNEVVYKKLKKWKDQGYNPGQIASMWNAGESKPNAYKENWRGVNEYGVAYDTPAYAEKVAQAYQRLKGQTAPIQAVATTSSPADPNAPQGFINDIGGSLAESGTKLATAVGDTFSGKINPVSGVIRSAGALAGSVGDVTTDVIRNTPVVGSLYQGAEDLVGKIGEGIAGTEYGQAGLKKYQEFAEKHPELAGNIGAGVDIVTAIPVLRGLKAGKKAIGGLVDTALHGKTDDVLEAVSAPLTPKEQARALVSRGTVKKGLLGDVHLADDAFDVKVRNAVAENVPKFNPSKGLLHNINETRTVITKLKNDLKKTVQDMGQDRIYSYKELGSSLRQIEMPDIVAADETLARLHQLLINRALKIAKDKGGKVSNLLDVRQDFDNMIKKQYGDIYSSERYSPLRQVVTEIRRELNDFTARALPEEAGLKQSLEKQHLLLEAVENMAEKASKGPSKELGVGPVSQFGQKHPVVKGLVKTGGQAAAQGLGLGAFTKLVD